MIYFTQKTEAAN